ncbi:MAG: glycosyltransferase family 2 protein [Elusimicrobia bacterium]|nr:glycosyltransferase family 2 protein [Elusimicrobiota bacterium]
MSERPDLSIVVPVYNEADCLELFHRELTGALRSMVETYEIVYVDDGSSDGSLEAVERIRRNDPAAAAVVLTRNFGHQLALTAGLEFAAGRAVITMDADLQHPPALIPRLVEEWRKGALVVSTVRTDTEDIGPFKRLTSRLFYGLINALSKTPVQPDAADFRLLDRRAVEALKSMRERHRFLRGMIGWLGYPETQVAFSAGKRAAGRSKYTWTRMFSFAADGIVSFSTLPLKAALLLGALALGLCGLYSIHVFYMFAFHGVLLIKGWASTVLLTVFLGGCQLILLGVTGEYIGRIYEEIKARPLFLVKELRGAGLGPMPETRP